MDSGISCVSSVPFLVLTHSISVSQEPLSEQLEQEMASRTSLEKEKQAILKELDQVRLQSEDVIHQWTGKVVLYYVYFVAP